MDLEYLEILERRVQEMIDLLRSTKEEKCLLEKQLADQAEAFQQLQQERGEVRQRVEKILGTLSNYNDDSGNAEMEQGGEQETSY